MSQVRNQKPKLRFREIDGRVTRLLRKYLIQAPPVSVREIAEGEGIQINYEPFHGGGDISAVLKRLAKRAVIGVNSAHSSQRQRFSIAHELGHFFLHENEDLFVDVGESLRKPKQLRFRNSLSSQATNQEEMEANAFAASLLMPKAMIHSSLYTLMDHDPDIAPEIATETLARLFDVSKAAMEYRLLNLGLLIKLDN